MPFRMKGPRCENQEVKVNRDDNDDVRKWENRHLCSEQKKSMKMLFANLKPFLSLHKYINFHLIDSPLKVRPLVENDFSLIKFFV